MGKACKLRKPEGGRERRAASQAVGGMGGTEQRAAGTSRCPCARAGTSPQSPPRPRAGGTCSRLPAAAREPRPEARAPRSAHDSETAGLRGPSRPSRPVPPRTARAASLPLSAGAPRPGCGSAGESPACPGRTFPYELSSAPPPARSTGITSKTKLRGLVPPSKRRGLWPQRLRQPREAPPIHPPQHVIAGPGRSVPNPPRALLEAPGCGPPQKISVLSGA